MLPHLRQDILLDLKSNCVGFNAVREIAFYTVIDNRGTVYLYKCMTALMVL